MIPYRQPVEDYSPNSNDDHKDTNVSESNVKEEPKRNPYSIEEILKKPSKQTKPPSPVSCANVHQPVGAIVTTEDFIVEENNEEKIDVD